MAKDPNHPKTVKDAVALLRAGGICAFPTETVYGLGADATNSDAVLAIYEAKQRPRFNPLIAHCADMEMTEKYVRFSPLARKLSQLWPGPLSLVLPLREEAGIADIVTAGLDTLATRVPAHPVARQIIQAVGHPLAAPSANPSGKLSATTAEQVKKGFNDAVPVFDGGNCEMGLESTIIAIHEERVVQLRAGALPRIEIEQFLNCHVELATSEVGISAPGMLASHYAPKADISLNVETPEPDAAYLGFGKHQSSMPSALNLSPSADLHEAARNLFAYLHALDAYGVSRICVAPIPETGLGEAINDRLRRAAAPRQ